LQKERARNNGQGAANGHIEMNKARVKKVVLALAAFLIVIQFLQPKRTNPPVVPSKSLAAHVAVPEEVHSTLMRACGDCHSNQTVWPWYSHWAPMSWMITDDVNQGRRHMNFQDWDAQPSPKQATDHLIDICKEARDKGMPPFTYRITHKNSRLTLQELGSLCSWSQSFGTAQQHGLSSN
jgi:Haem-binding domain